MIAKSNHLRDIFWQEVPRLYMRNLLKVLDDCYVKAEAECKRIGFADPEAENVMWGIRRGLVEGGMRDAATLFPSMNVKIVYGRQQKPKPHPWNHNRVECGRVWLTQATVPHPEHLVKPSVSREMYAKPNSQRLLFPEFEPKPSSPESKLYGILLHGRVPKTDQLGFAMIRFPTVDLKGYWAETIDLFAEFPEVLSYRKPQYDHSGLVPSEDVGDLPDVEIREDSAG